MRANVVASQAELHARYGGVVPEVASRRHLELVGPVLTEALEQGGADPRRRRVGRRHARPGADRRAARRPLGREGARLVAAAPARARSTTSTGTSRRSTSSPSRSSRRSSACSRAAGTRCSSTCATHAGLRGRRDDARRRGGRGLRQGRPPARARLPGRSGARPGGPRRRPEAYAFPVARVPGLDFSFSGLKTALLYAVRDLSAGRARAPARRPGGLVPARDRPRPRRADACGGGRAGRGADRRRRRRRGQLRAPEPPSRDAALAPLRALYR